MWLRDGEYSALVSHQGGSVNLYQHRDRTILGPARMVEVADELKVRGETHWCLPQFGTDRRKGLQARQPQHGFLRETPLELFSHAEAFVKFDKKSCMDPYDREKRLHIETGVEVRGKGLIMSLFVWNKMDVPYPVLPALHPYFSVPMGGATLRLGDEEFSHREVPSKARIISGLGPYAKLSVLLHGVGLVEMVCSPACTNVAVWSDNPREYVCIEPVFGTVGSYGEEPPEGLWLEPGQMEKWKVSFHFMPAL